MNFKVFKIFSFSLLLLLAFVSGCKEQSTSLPLKINENADYAQLKIPVEEGKIPWGFVESIDTGTFTATIFWRNPDSLFQQKISRQFYDNFLNWKTTQPKKVEQCWCEELKNKTENVWPDGTTTKKVKHCATGQLITVDSGKGCCKNCDEKR